jgi:hypothetical protein
MIESIPEADRYGLWDEGEFAKSGVAMGLPIICSLMLFQN